MTLVRRDYLEHGFGRRRTEQAVEELGVGYRIEQLT
jgi:hypothetical protein